MDIIIVIISSIGSSMDCTLSHASDCMVKVGRLTASRVCWNVNKRLYTTVCLLWCELIETDRQVSWENCWTLISRQRCHFSLIVCLKCTARLHEPEKASRCWVHAMMGTWGGEYSGVVFQRFWLYTQLQCPKKQQSLLQPLGCGDATLDDTHRHQVQNGTHAISPVHEKLSITSCIVCMLIIPNTNHTVANTNKDQKGAMYLTTIPGPPQRVRCTGIFQYKFWLSVCRLDYGDKWYLRKWPLP